MKSHILIIINLVIINCVCAQHPSIDPNYTLIFEDNFNQQNIDSNKWKILEEEDWDHGSAGQYLVTNRPQNINIGDGVSSEGVGVVNFTAREENYNGYNHTAAEIQSKDKFGPNIYIEARSKLPKKKTRCFW